MQHDFPDPSSVAVPNAATELVLCTPCRSGRLYEFASNTSYVLSEALGRCRLSAPMNDLVGALEAMGPNRLWEADEGEPFAALCSFARRAEADLCASGIHILAGRTLDQATLVIVFEKSATIEYQASVRFQDGRPTIVKA